MLQEYNFNHIADVFVVHLNVPRTRAEEADEEINSERHERTLWAAYRKSGSKVEDLYNSRKTHLQEGRSVSMASTKSNILELDYYEKIDSTFLYLSIIIFYLFLVNWFVA